MKRQKISTIVLGLVLSLVMVLNAGMSVSAVEQPRESDYLSSYSAYIIPKDNGQMDISYKVFSVGIADEMGASQVVVEKLVNNSWTQVANFNSSNTSGLAGYNIVYKGGIVSFTGVKGQTYRAKVTVYAKKGSGSDSRVITTETVVL